MKIFIDQVAVGTYVGSEPLRMVDTQYTIGNKENPEWSGGHVISGGDE